MGLWDALKGEVRRQYIARPDVAKEAIVYKHPDQNIRRGTELTVAADEVALFFRDGQPRGTLPPGRHTLETENTPFLGMLVDAATGGNAFLAELYFVTTRELPGVKFGGPIGDLMDPQTQLVVSTTVFGEFSVRVSDPGAFVLGFVGLGKKTNDEILGWFKQLFLRTIKDAVAELIVKQGWALLQVTSGAFTEEIAAEVLKRAEAAVAKYGLQIVNLGNFHVSIKEEDAATLKKFAKDAAMSRMTGGYQNYAMGEAMMSGKGGGGGAGVEMMGMVMAQQMMQQMRGNTPAFESPFAAPAPAAPAASAAATPGALPAPPADDARTRLAKLKALADDGLITAEEYEARRKEILATL